MTAALALSTGTQVLMIVLPVLTLVIATIATTLRFYARFLKKTVYGPDDWLCLVALIFAYGLFITNCISVVYGGLGLTILKLTTANIISFFKTLLALGSLWACAVTALQISILLFYIRLFGITRWFRILCYCVMGFCGAWWIAIFGGTMGACIPLDKLWNPKKSGQCANMSRACAGTGLAHVFLDFIVLLLPLPVIWRLHTTSANKVTFTIVFTIGIFATICSVLRIGCLVTLLKIDEADFTGSGWLSILFEVLEVNLGILCICIPTFPPVWVQVSRSGFGSYAKYLLGASQRSDPESGEGKAARWNRGASLPRSNEFERLDDSRTHIVRAEPGEELPMHALGRGDVNVTRGWEVKRG